MLVLGARPNIDAMVRQAGAEPQYAAGQRVTDARTMQAAMQAAGAARMLVEARLSKVRLRVQGTDRRPASARCSEILWHRLQKEGLGGAVGSPFPTEPCALIWELEARGLSLRCGMATAACGTLCCPLREVPLTILPAEGMVAATFGTSLDICTIETGGWGPAVAASLGTHPLKICLDALLLYRMPPCIPFLCLPWTETL